MCGLYYNEDNDIVLAKFISYMNKALLNRRINYLKYNQNINSKEVNLDQKEWEILSVEDDINCSFYFTDEKYEELFEDDKLISCIKKLTELQKEVLYLYIEENMSMVAISKILNVSASAIQRIIERAKNKIKKNLEEK